MRAAPCWPGLIATASQPTYQVRFRWRTDSFAMWDNRSTQHCAAQDFGTQRRRVERVTLLGERPFGPAAADGRVPGQRQPMIRRPPFPTTPDALTADVLTEALGAPVKSFTACPSAPTGACSAISSSSSRPTRDCPARPASWPSSPPHREGSLASARRSGSHHRELRFYDELAPSHPGARAPRLRQLVRRRLGRSSSSSKRPSTSTPRSTKWSASTSTTPSSSLVEVARLHATWWDHPRLPTLDWLPRLDGPARRHNLATITRTGWEPLCDLLGDALTPRGARTRRGAARTRRRRPGAHRPVAADADPLRPAR